MNEAEAFNASASLPRDIIYLLILILIKKFQIYRPEKNTCPERRIIYAENINWKTCIASLATNEHQTWFQIYNAEKL